MSATDTDSAIAPQPNPFAKAAYLRCAPPFSTLSSPVAAQFCVLSTRQPTVSGSTLAQGQHARALTGGSRAGQGEEARRRVRLDVVVR